MNVTELGSGKHSFMKNLINMKTEFIVTDKKKELGKGIHLRKKHLQISAICIKTELCISDFIVTDKKKEG